METNQIIVYYDSSMTFWPCSNVSISCIM